MSELKTEIIPAWTWKCPDCILTVIEYQQPNPNNQTVHCPKCGGNAPFDSPSPPAQTGQGEVQSWVCNAHPCGVKDPCIISYPATVMHGPAICPHGCKGLLEFTKLPTPPAPSVNVERILQDILIEIKGRNGLQEVWEMIDDEIQEEILHNWGACITNHLVNSPPSVPVEKLGKLVEEYSHAYTGEDAIDIIDELRTIITQQEASNGVE